MMLGTTNIKNFIYYDWRIWLQIIGSNPVAAQSKTWVCSRSLAGIVGSNLTGGMDVCLLWVCVCCQVEVSYSDWSLAQRSVSSECYREAP